MAGKGFGVCLPRVSGQVFTHLGSGFGREEKTDRFKVHYELRPETSGFTASSQTQSHRAELCFQQILAEV